MLELLKATGWTLALTVLSMPLAVTAGLFLALLRMSRRSWLSWPAAVYIEIVRGTPLLVQMFLVYYSLPGLGRSLHEQMAGVWPGLADLVGPQFLTWPPFVVGVICLAGNYAAYEAEIHRAGLQAIDRGQREAALSLGLSERQAFLLVVLPQAFRIVVPPIVNDLIAMLKDTSLVMTISVAELMYTAQSIGRNQFKIPQMMFASAVIYLVLSLGCYLFGQWVEKQMKVHGQPELHLDQVRH